MMKQTTKDILKAIIVLGVISLIAGLLMGVVYPLTRLTQAEIDKQAMKPLAGIYPADGYEVVHYKPDEQGLADSVPYFFKVLGKENAFIALSIGGGGYGGDVQMYVVFEGNEIVKLAKGKNGESIEVSENFYQQFYGKDIEKYPVFHLDDGENRVDKQAGATMSCTAITNAVNNAIKYYKSYQVRNFISYEKGESGAVTFTVRQQGSYEGAEENKVYYVELIVKVGNGVIQSVEDHGSTFSPPPWNPGLKPENLNRYVGKGIAGRGDFVIGTDIDYEAGATGTSEALLSAMNRIVKVYNEEVAV